MSSVHSESTYESDHDAGPSDTREAVAVVAVENTTNSGPTGDGPQNCDPTDTADTADIDQGSGGVVGASTMIEGSSTNEQQEPRDHLIGAFGSEALDAGRTTERAAEFAIGRIASALGIPNGVTDGVEPNSAPSEASTGVVSGSIGFEIAPEAQPSSDQPIGTAVNPSTDPGALTLHLIHPSITSNNLAHPVLSVRPHVEPPGAAFEEADPSAQDDLPNDALTAEDILAALAYAASDEADKEEAVRTGIPRAVRFEKGFVLYGIRIEPITSFIASITAPLKLLEVHQILDRNKTPKAYYRIDTRLNAAYDTEAEKEIEKERARREKVNRDEEKRLDAEKENENERREKEDEDRRWAAVENEGRGGPATSITGGQAAAVRMTDVIAPASEDPAITLVAPEDEERLPEPEDLLPLAGPSHDDKGTAVDATIDELPPKKFPIIRELRIDIHTLHPAAIFFLEVFRRQELDEEPLPVTMVEYIQNITVGKADPLVPIPKHELQVVPKRGRRARAEIEAAAAALSRRREEALRNAPNEVENDGELKDVDMEEDDPHEHGDSSEEERKKRRAKRNRDTDSEQEFRLSVPGGKRTLTTRRKLATRARSAERTPTPPRASRHRGAIASSDVVPKRRGRPSKHSTVGKTEEVVSEEEAPRKRSRRSEVEGDSGEQKRNAQPAHPAGRPPRGKSPEAQPRRSTRNAVTPEPEHAQHRRSRHQPEAEVASTRRSKRGEMVEKPGMKPSRKRKARSAEVSEESTGGGASTAKRARSLRGTAKGPEVQPGREAERCQAKADTKPSFASRPSRSSRIAEEPSPLPRKRHKQPLRDESPPTKVPRRRREREEIPRKSGPSKSRSVAMPPKKRPPSNKDAETSAEKLAQLSSTEPKRRKHATGGGDWMDLLQVPQGDAGRWEAVVLVASAPNQEHFEDVERLSDSSDEEVLAQEERISIFDQIPELEVSDELDPAVRGESSAIDGQASKQDGMSFLGIPDDGEISEDDGHRSEGSLPDLPPITTLMKGKRRAQAK